MPFVREWEPGLVVRGGDSYSKGPGFKSQHCILDRIFFHIYCCKNCNDVCLKDQKTDPFYKKCPLDIISPNLLELIPQFYPAVARTGVDPDP